MWKSNQPIEPNLGLDLTTAEDALVHVEDVLPALVGLQEASEAYHTTLLLPAELARGQAHVYADDPLLDAHFSVQISQSTDRQFLVFEFSIEVLLPLDQAVGAPGDQVFAVGQVGHLLRGPGKPPGLERLQAGHGQARQQSLFTLFQSVNSNSCYVT